MTETTFRIPSIGSVTESDERQKFELKGERIQSAFQAPPSDTRSSNNTDKFRTDGDYAPPALHRGLIFRTSPASDRLARFVTEQRWQGYVTGVSEKTFSAIVFDMSEADEIETVEFEHKDVHVLMRDLIRVDAVLFWDIGYEVDPGEQRNRKSIISFPTIHIDTTRRMDAAKARASARFKELGWDRREQSGSEPEGSTGF
jgi:hypothetical protein